MARNTLIAAWVVVSAAVAWMLIGGVRETDANAGLRHLLHVVYALALLWYLARDLRRVDTLAEVDAPLFADRQWVPWVPAILVALMLVLVVLSEDGFDLLVLGLMLATAWILVAWWRRIRLRGVLQGIALALVAYLAGLPAANNAMIGESTILLLAALAAPMYVAGGLLVERTGLGGARLFEGAPKRALAGFLRGCLLFVPLGLLNAADGGPGDDIGWVTEWWMPLSLPSFSGIAEEVWFRLMLTGLCYFLLRPALRGRSLPAVVCALLFSSIVFGLGHGRDPETFLTTGLLYGVPMAAVFVRQDWEHAVGAHYMINMVSWWMVYFEGWA